MPEKVEAVGSLIASILSIVAIIFLAYFFIRLMGKKYQAGASGTGYIKILDRISVGQDRMLCIVQTAGKTLLIGVTPQHIEMLSVLEADALPPPQDAPEMTPFLKTLEQFMHKNQTQSVRRPFGEGKEEHHDGE